MRIQGKNVKTNIRDEHSRMGWEFKDGMRIQGWDENTSTYKGWDYKDGFILKDAKTSMEWEQKIGIKIQFSL